MANSQIARPDPDTTGVEFVFDGHQLPGRQAAAGYATIVAHQALPQRFVIVGWLMASDLLMARMMGAVRGFGMAEEMADATGRRLAATGYCVHPEPEAVHTLWAHNQPPDGDARSVYHHMMAKTSRISPHLGHTPPRDGQTLADRCAELSRLAAELQADAMENADGWIPCDCSLFEATDQDIVHWDPLLAEIKNTLMTDMPEGPSYRYTGDGLSTRKGLYQQLADRIGREFAQMLISRSHISVFQEVQRTTRRMADATKTPPGHQPGQFPRGMINRRIGGELYAQEPTWGIRRPLNRDSRVLQDFLDTVQSQGLDMEQEKTRLLTDWDHQPMEPWARLEMAWAKANPEYRYAGILGTPKPDQRRHWSNTPQTDEAAK